MANVNVLRGMRSGHSEHDFLILDVTPREAAELVAALGKMLARVADDGFPGPSAEVPISGTIYSDATNASERIDGRLSVHVHPEARCIHPGCGLEFTPQEGVKPAGFRRSGLVCAEHAPKGSP